MEITRMPAMGKSDTIESVLKQILAEIQTNEQPL